MLVMQPLPEVRHAHDRSPRAPATLHVPALKRSAKLFMRS
jgi:hypothetical protein